MALNRVRTEFMINALKTPRIEIRGCQVYSVQGTQEVKRGRI
jgi:hypothetical protein